MDDEELLDLVELEIRELAIQAMISQEMIFRSYPWISTMRALEGREDAIGKDAYPAKLMEGC